MGKKSSAKNKLSLKNDITPVKFVLFIFPFIVEAVISSIFMGANDAVTVLLWSMIIFLFGVGVFPLTAKIFNRFGSGGFILAQALGMTQSAVSHQLRILRQARLVSSRREGKQVIYFLTDEHVRTIIDKGREHIEED